MDFEVIFTEGAGGSQKTPPHFRSSHGRFGFSRKVPGDNYEMASWRLPQVPAEGPVWSIPSFAARVVNSVRFLSFRETDRHQLWPLGKSRPRLHRSHHKVVFPTRNILSLSQPVHSKLVPIKLPLTRLGLRVDLVGLLS